jgi:hypothetical protein
MGKSVVHESDVQWVEIGQVGPRVKNGLEGNVCFGGHSCLTRPQRQVAASPEAFAQSLRKFEEIVQQHVR